MIKAESITKSFGQIKAVSNLSFEIKKGEVVGFLGPNGAGKTTTMRLLTGFYSPDSGTIEIAGISVEEDTIEAQRHIGYLPENNPLYKDMLVSEFLSFAAELKRIPKHKRASALDFAIDAVSIGDVYYRPIAELSKGYRQRVGLAAALLHRPDILIMDEPTEGLDPNQRAGIRSLIRGLARDRTIIMSTHVMGEAQAVCDRMFIINNGSLIADGTPGELARIAGRERVVVVEIEGEGVEIELKKLKGVEHAEIERIETEGGAGGAGGERIRARLVTSRSTELQPEISRLVRERGWTVWRLAELEHSLEDIFHKLTSES